MRERNVTARYLSADSKRFAVGNTYAIVTVVAIPATWIKVVSLLYVLTELGSWQG